MNHRLSRRDLNDLEIKLNKMSFKDIPKEFIEFIDNQFSSYAYLRSLIEMKKDVK